MSSFCKKHSKENIFCTRGWAYLYHRMSKLDKWCWQEDHCFPSTEEIINKSLARKIISTTQKRRRSGWHCQLFSVAGIMKYNPLATVFWLTLPSVLFPFFFRREYCFCWCLLLSIMEWLRTQNMPTCKKCFSHHLFMTINLPESWIYLLAYYVILSFFQQLNNLKMQRHCKVSCNE